MNHGGTITPAERASIRAYAQSVVAGFAPLDDAQKERLALLLRPGLAAVRRERARGLRIPGAAVA